MTERPIIFSAESVRAILDGRKTQTRRVMNPQPWIDPHGALLWQRGMFGVGYVDARNGPHPEWLEHCPYGLAGDRLWVREAWAILTGNGHRIVYRADGDPPIGLDGTPVSPMRWTSPLWLPRRDARLFLDVVSVRVERLQAITEADAQAEGVAPARRCTAAEWMSDAPPPVERVGRGKVAVRPYTLGFMRAWDQINGARASWASNPFVWVITFRLAAGGAP